MDILLVGTGRIARDYTSVLTALTQKIQVVGRSVTGTQKFIEETGVNAVPGGVTKWAKSNVAPKHAIVAVDANQLVSATKQVIHAGSKKILVEKPGGMTIQELKSLASFTKEEKAQIYIGYNRRFYASTKKAQEIIKKDGGAESFSFQFNERLTQRDKLKELGIPEQVQNRWFIVNSTHVIDLAFFLCGYPQKICCASAAGSLWGKQPTFFTGAGITKQGTFFSYHSNWELPGTWRIEIGTKKRKLIFDPLESLVQEIDGVVTPVPFNNIEDIDYKPGLFNQTKTFLKDAKNIPTLQEQIEAFGWYEKIERGNT